jgi:hypothetical protein
MQIAEERFMIFYLGTPAPKWLWETKKPLFVSRRTLSKLKSFKRATCRWALDSGAYSEFTRHGKWNIEPDQYIDEVHKWDIRIGNMDFCVIMDWPCYSFSVKATGKSVEYHQMKTIENYAYMLSEAPSLPWIASIQGNTIEEYVHHREMYEKEGFKLGRIGIGGIGTSRGSSSSAQAECRKIVEEMCDLHIHAFGIESLGIRAFGSYLMSADSMAWTYRAWVLQRKYGQSTPGHSHNRCNRCLPFALEWLKLIEYEMGKIEVISVSFRIKVREGKIILS